MPGISVIVPCYNHASYVESCLRSIDGQRPGVPLEIIVLDDGSTDETWSRIEAFQFDPSHEVVRVRTENRGAHAALNDGLRRARGDWVTICNSDDLFASQRLARLGEWVSRSGAAFAFTRVFFVDPQGTDVTASDPYAASLAARQTAISGFPSVGWSLIETNVAISTGNFFFRRDLLAQLGDFRPYRLAHDWDFILRALLLTEPLYVPEPLYGYRLHTHNSFAPLTREDSPAAHECPELMRRYWKAATGRAPANHLAPSPWHWPVFCEAFLGELRYQSYLTGWGRVDEPRWTAP